MFNKTFQEEFEFLYKNVPDALYGTYEKDFWGRFYEKFKEKGLQEILEDLLAVIGKTDDSKRDISIAGGDSEKVQPTEIKGVKTIEELIELLVQIIMDSKSDNRAADLVAELGEDCFGMYLPMHAFYCNPKTPWGIYLFPSLLKWRAEWLYNIFKNIFPNKKLEDYVRVKVYGTFRHMVFQYQTERFATKQEILSLSPIYKPYNKMVEKNVKGTQYWLEKALAESAVHKSRFILNKTNQDSDFVKQILTHCSNNKGDGYSHYKCKVFSGVNKAHKVFATQIIFQEVEPEIIVSSICTVKQEFIENGLNVPIYIYDKGYKKKGNKPDDAI